MKKTLCNLAYALGVIAFILLMWFLISVKANNEYVLPKISAVFKETLTLFSEKFFWKSFFATLLRTLIGFLLSFVFALLFALCFKYFKFTQKAITILVGILRAVPTIAIILNLLLWTNTRIAPVIIACLVTLPGLYSSLLEQLNGFDTKLVEMCRLYGKTEKEIFTKVYVPGVMPNICLTLSSYFALTLKLIGSSEALCSTLYSIGWLMKDSRDYAPARLMAISVICIVVAIMLENLLNFIIKKIWRIEK